jgi:hypothetical protein
MDFDFIFTPYLPYSLSHHIFPETKLVFHTIIKG